MTLAAGIVQSDMCESQNTQTYKLNADINVPHMGAREHVRQVNYCRYKKRKMAAAALFAILATWNRSKEA